MSSFLSLLLRIFTALSLRVFTALATMSRKTHFCCCIPIHSDQDLEEKLEKLRQSPIKSFTGQLECSEAGHLHLQLVLVTNYATTTQRLSKQIGFQQIQVCENIETSIRYCTDEAKRVEGTEIFTHGAMPKFRTTNSTFYYKLAQVTSRDEALELFNQPEYLDKKINQSKSIMQYIDSTFPQEYVRQYEPEEFTVRQLDFSDPKTPKTVLVVGPTGIGKTQWCLSHFQRPVIVSNPSAMCKINAEADGVVFDDFVQHNFAPASLLNLCDSDKAAVVNIKYSHAEIPADMPRFFCLNSEGLFWPKSLNPERNEFNSTPEDQEALEEIKKAIQRRILIVKFNTQLFEGQPKHLEKGTLHGKCISQDELLKNKTVNNQLKQAVTVKRAKPSPSTPAKKKLCSSLDQFDEPGCSFSLAKSPSPFTDVSE